MKKYSFEGLRHVRAGIIAISYFILTFALVTLLAVYTQMAILCIVVWFASIAAPIIFYKKIIPIYEETITITEEGFHVKSENRNVKWGNIRWYRFDNNTSPIMDIVEFGIDNEKRLSLVFYKKTNKLNDWLVLKNDIIDSVTQKSENLRNYYDIKVWETLIKVIFLSWVIIPFVLIGFGVEIIKAIPMVLIYVGSTIPIIVKIKNQRGNQSKN